MALIVIGGHTRNIGKTSVVARLITAMPELRWTAMKITQFGHGICSRDGKSCNCATDNHTWAIDEEKDAAGDSDTSRYLAAGAERSLWVRTQQGRLAEAMPEVRKKLADAGNAILESNSVMRFVKPDLYITVLDPATADFKASAQEFLDRADAVLLHRETGGELAWENVSLASVAGRPLFRISPPDFLTPEVVDFVRERLKLPTTAQ